MVDTGDSFDRVELLTQSEYARRKTWSRQRVNRLVKDGKIPLHQGLIDPVEADRILLESANASYAHNQKNSLPLAPTPAPPATPQPPPPPPSASQPDGVVTDEEGVDQLFEHLKTVIFKAKDASEIPHIAIKKLNDFISAVQRKLEVQEHAGTLISKLDAQDQFVQVSGQVREGLLNVADQVAGATSAKALQLLRDHLPPDSQAVLETLMQGKQWEDLFHQTINAQMNEVLRAFSRIPDMVRET